MMVTENFIEDEDIQGPGHAFLPFMVMEDLLDKLKLLDYDIQFVSELKMRPLNRHYFVIQTNPGEQFFVFTSLCAWLIRRSGHQFDQPQEHDDPNTIISNILQHVRQLGVVIDFAPSKLKQGYGEHAIFVLDRLTDEALRAVKWQWKKPIPPTSGGQEEPDDVDDEDEIILEKLEEEMAEDYSDEDEADILHINQVTPPTSARDFSHAARPRSIMEARADVDAWRLEVERVAPSLKVTVKMEARDWRSHLEQIHSYRTSIDSCLKTAKVDLGTQISYFYKHLQEYMFRETSEGTERDIGAGWEQREIYQSSAGISTHKLQTVVPGENQELKTCDDDDLFNQGLAQSKEQQRQVGAVLGEKNRLLQQLTEDIDSVKTEMEERGSSMTDGSPLVNIKKAVSRVKREIINMDVMIGVLQHGLMEAGVKDKDNMNKINYNDF